jgi:hypothetical protein
MLRLAEAVVIVVAVDRPVWLSVESLMKSLRMVGS